MYPFFTNCLYYGLSQDAGYRSLCCTVGPCYLSILHTDIYMCGPQPPTPHRPQPCPPWPPRLFSVILSLFPRYVCALSEILHAAGSHGVRLSLLTRSSCCDHLHSLPWGLKRRYDVRAISVRCVCVPRLLDPLTAPVPLGRLRTSAVIPRAALTIGLQLSYKIVVFSRSVPRHELMGHTVLVCLMFERTPILFPLVDVPISIPPTV